MEGFDFRSTDGNREQEHKINITYLRLNNLQIPHLNPTRREIRNLELHTNRPLRALPSNTSHTPTKSTSHTTAVLIITLHTGQSQLRTHQKLLVTTKLLNFPHNCALL